MSSQLDNMMKIKLIDNNKRPISKKWNNMKTTMKLNCNYGLLTGKDNGITVVDVDFYDKKGKIFNPDESSFINRFSKDYINKFNTLTQQTPNKGFHLIFKYDRDLTKTENATHQIDIRNNGCYIVGYNSSINNVKYTIYKDTTIKQIPQELKEWLLENIYSKKEIKIIERKNKDIKLEEKGDFKYKNGELEKKMLVEIFEILDKKYYTVYGRTKKGIKSWFNYTTFCKIINTKDLWDKYSKKYGGKTYNKENNLKIWEQCEIKYDCFTKIFNDSSIKTLKEYKYYIKYKPLNPFTLIPDNIINSKKLGYDFINKYKSNNLIIKSDTGTGKTTAFKHYVKDNNLKFISIVSRVTLSDEQYKVFNKHNIDCSHYSQLNYKMIDNGDSLIITIDSILKLEKCKYIDIDYSNYVILLDEYNSLIEYLINSSTLKPKRILIYKYFIKILNECKKIISVDADISEISIKFMEIIDKKTTIIENKYKHNKGIKAYEIHKFKDLVNDLKKKEKYIVCCDSKKEAIILHNSLGGKKTNIKLITNDTGDIIDLNKDNRIIYSPKVLYGLDSTIVRPVYCYYTTYTINAESMLQQIARTRNITKLKYYFVNKRLMPCKYKDIEDCIYYNKQIRKIENNYSEYDINKKYKEKYFELYCLIDYKNDCYQSNMFLHFLNLLWARGFIVMNFLNKSGRINNMKKNQKEEIINKYNKDNFDYNNQKVKKIAKILCLHSNEEIDKYKDVFLNDFSLNKHFTICNYFFKEKNYLINKIEYNDEMLIKKLKSYDNRLIFLKELQKRVKFNDNDEFKIGEMLSDKDNIKYYDKYRILFIDRSNNDNKFKNEYHIIKTIVKMIKNILGNVIDAKTKRENKTRIYKYKWTSKFKKEINEFHKKLYDIRGPKAIEYSF